MTLTLPTRTAGHEVASHTWAHANISSLTADQLHDQMWKVELALQRIVGVQPALFRPPYGEYNAAALKVVGKRNQSGMCTPHLPWT